MITINQWMTWALKSAAHWINIRCGSTHSRTSNYSCTRPSRACRSRAHSTFRIFLKCIERFVPNPYGWQKKYFFLQKSLFRIKTKTWITMQIEFSINFILLSQAERRLSPDFSRCDKALYCTTKSHRCLHAAHAYTGIPCAAYSKPDIWTLVLCFEWKICENASFQ